MTPMHSQYLIGFGTAFAAGLILTPVFGRISASAGLIDYPSSRKFHLTKMPMMGGLAVAAAFLIVYIGAVKFALKGDLPVKFIGAIAASLIMLSLGLVDDFKNVPPKIKLIGQFAAAAILLACGLRASMTGIAPLDWIFTFVWFAGIVNCLNLLDNIDGLAGGAAAVAGGFFFLAAAALGRADIAIAAAVFSGACSGFLAHNFHPASIFSGDAGSMFMGSMLASFGLFFMSPGHGLPHSIAILFPGVILGLLIFDTGLVTIMRVTHGKKITDGGKDHTSHRLCILGLSVQASVIALFAACFIFGIAGVSMLPAMRLVSPARAVYIPLCLLIISLILWALLGKLYNYDQDRDEAAN